MTDINPIIPGFAPDPSVVKVGDWYYLVNSSFHLFPGLPIYASKDLLSWHQIGNAIYRQGQLSLARSNTNLNPSSGTGYSQLATGGLYAPTIRHDNGTFYVICTNAIRADKLSADPKAVKKNFIVSTKDIWANEWSDPVYFDFDGIDPSLFFDGDKVYAQGAGELGIKDGTHENHMVTMARSKDIWGPYEGCPNNPILTARGTSEYIQHVGHCDAFEDGEGNWWGVCLAVRKDSSGRQIMGRETFLTSGRWDEEWLSFDRVQRNLNPTYSTRPEVCRDLSTEPNVDFVYIRDPDLSKYNILNSGAQVTLTASKIDLPHPTQSPTFVGKRQRRLSGESIVTLRHSSSVPEPTKLKAGLACYKDEHRYARVFYEAASSEVVFELVNHAQKTTRTEKHTVPSFEELTLRMTYTEQSYTISYRAWSGSDEGFTQIASIDTLALTAVDFVGTVIGIFAVSEDDGPVVEFTNLSIE
ncbi:Concanavalin A-like lectin/glucanases superfamily [Penicillium expansum]|nr:Concanavalin A-like lectin/glucanases superfamily [Penicillium expansum]